MAPMAKHGTTYSYDVKKCRCGICTQAKRVRQQQYRTTKNGQQRHKEASTRSHKKWQAWLNELKAEPCVDCGDVFPPECMDFDHVRGQKLFGIGLMGTRRRDVVLAEIAKCELVCANCHRIRTRQREALTRAALGEGG